MMPMDKYPAILPYYADPDYKTYFKRMITTVRQHLETLPANVRMQIVAVQACFEVRVIT